MDFYIKNDTLFVTLDFNYEFSINDIFDYIKKSKILFKGTKIVLISSGITLATLFLNPMKIEEYPTVQSIIEVIQPTKVDVSKLSKPEITLSNNENIILPPKSINKEIVKKEEIKEQEKNSIVEEINKEETKPQIEEKIALTNKAETIVTVYRNNGQIINIELETYLIGVVASEMPASFNIEALKAQSVAARTYTLKCIKNNKKLTDTISTQVYKDDDELKKMRGNEFNKYYEKIKKAVNSTKGIVMKYNDELIDAVYHSTSNGYTESALNVWGNDIPYLQSVSSEWDLTSSSYLKTIEKDFNTINNVLNINLNDSTDINVLERDETNHIKTVQINNKIFSGVELRTLLGLRSTDIEFEIKDNSIIFTTKGYGHGVGMSQYGAQGMAKNGYTYSQILKHYYLGITLN